MENVCTEPVTKKGKLIALFTKGKGLFDKSLSFDTEADKVESAFKLALFVGVFNVVSYFVLGYIFALFAYMCLDAGDLGKTSGFVKEFGFQYNYLLKMLAVFVSLPLFYYYLEKLKISNRIEVVNIISFIVIPTAVYIVTDSHSLPFVACIFSAMYFSVNNKGKLINKLPLAIFVIFAVSYIQYDYNLWIFEIGQKAKVIQELTSFSSSRYGLSESRAITFFVFPEAIRISCLFIIFYLIPKSFIDKFASNDSISA